MSSQSMQIAVVVSQPFAENSYIAHLPGSGHCVVVDPGLQPRLIMNYLNQAKLLPSAILNTHGHADHIGGNEFLKRRWPECPLVIGRGDAPKLTDPEQNLSGQFGLGLVSPPADRLVDEGEQIEYAGMKFQVRETPGHSSGHVVFVYKEASPYVVFGGDVLFQRGIGRTDFPDGDYNTLVRSIREKLFTLPDDTLVLSGHGEATTIGEEKRLNPFVGEAANE